MSDLLRQTKIDYAGSVREAKSIIPTAAADRSAPKSAIASSPSGSARLVIENSEPAPYRPGMLATKPSNPAAIEAVSPCCDRGAVLFCWRLHFDIVFHAAALSARAAAGAGLGRGRQDQRLRLGQRRDAALPLSASGGDLDRQGDRWSCSAPRVLRAWAADNDFARKGDSHKEVAETGGACD
jgi:hypothetical protein